jgi:hypothetical protein
MGCTVSVQVSTNKSQRIPLKSFRGLSSRTVVPCGVILPTTVGLEGMLRQNHVRDKMRQFCEDSWDKISTILPEAMPCISGYNRYSCRHTTEVCSTSCLARHVAINCINFWADIEDLKQIPRSSFKNYRIVEIIQKYVTYGAAKKVSCSIFMLYRWCQ